MFFHIVFLENHDQLVDNVFFVDMFFEFDPIKFHEAEYRSQKNFFNINNARLSKLTCSGYLQSKSASPKLLGTVDFN
jgi:hypothetical protein